MNVTYSPLEYALQYRWSALTKRQTKEVNPTLFFAIMGEKHTSLIALVFRHSIHLQAIWQFESSHGGLPNSANQFAELEAIANQLISAASVNKQVLSTIPPETIEYAQQWLVLTKY